MIYAQIAPETRICVAQTETAPMVSPIMIAIPEFDDSLFQKRHNEETNEWESVAPPTRRILTHLEFRRRFTPLEQELSDELEATFEGNGALSAEQKRKLRTGYKNFNAATTVNLDDPDIPPMLAMYAALGILEAHRPAEILA